MPIEDAYLQACERLRAIPHTAILGGIHHVSKRQSESETCMLVVRGGNAEAAITDSDLTALCLMTRNTRECPERLCLDLSDQPITCSGAEMIATVLQSRCFIQALRLRSTCIGDHGVATLGSALGCSALTELDLSHCRISDRGMHFFSRALHLHGTPQRLQTLLLGGNPSTGEGVTELISLLESDQCPPALTTFSALPGPSSNSQVSEEIETALRVVCKLRGVAFVETLPVPSSSQSGAAKFSSFGGITGPRHGRMQGNDEYNNKSGASFLVQSLQMEDDPLSDADSWARHLGKGQQNVTAHSRRPESPTASDNEEMRYKSATRKPSALHCADLNGWGRQLPGTPSILSGRTTPSGIQTPPRCDAGQASCGSPQQKYGKHQEHSPPHRAIRDSEHLAAWMTEIERELTDLKGLLSANMAQLDAQHKKKVVEVSQLTKRLDAWERLQDVSDKSSGQADVSLGGILTQIDKLEESIGHGKSECLGMWRLILSAIGEEAPAQAAGGARQPMFQNQATATPEPIMSSTSTPGSVQSQDVKQEANLHVQRLISGNAAGKMTSHPINVDCQEQIVQQLGKKLGYKPKAQRQNPAVYGRGTKSSQAKERGMEPATRVRESNYGRNLRL